MKTVVGVFPSEQEAARVAHELEMTGISSDEVIVADGTYVGRCNECPKECGWSLRTVAAAGTSGFGWLVAGLLPMIGKRSRGGSVILGASLGGVAGIAAGAVALAVAGTAPLVAGTALATILATMGFGAVSGALLAGAYNMGVSHEQAPLCEQARREQGIVVAAHVEDATEPAAMRVMSAHNARSLRAGADAWAASGSPGRPPDGEELYPSDSTFKSHGELRW